MIKNLERARIKLERLQKLFKKTFQSDKSKWDDGVNSEIHFWESYFATKGLEWKENYELRMDPALPLQDLPASLLCEDDELILDVGSGPLTSLGKIHPNGLKRLKIIAVDPLANEYEKLLAKYKIQPLVKSEKLAAEELTQRFKLDCFDLVYARNSIDHAIDPEKAISQMIAVVRKGKYVLLDHRINEAENQNYEGLHQWNFSLSEEGHFIIRGKITTVNMTEKYKNICSITSELIDKKDKVKWLLVKIRKL